MNTQEILKKIGTIIEELAEQHEYLSNSKEINPLELELFSASADFLTDHIAVLNKLNQVNVNIPLLEEGQPTDSAVAEEPKKEEPLPPQSNHMPVADLNSEENESVERSGFKFDFSEPQELEFDFEKSLEVNQIFDRKLSNEEQELVDKLKQTEEEEYLPIQEENVETEVAYVVTDKDSYPEADEVAVELEEEQEKEPFVFIKEEPPVTVSQSQIVEEQKQPAVEEQERIIEAAAEPAQAPAVQQAVKHEIPEIKPTVEPERPMSLNEMLSAQRGAVTSNTRPITDLKAAISLNDKMIFIKELFNGYNLAYSEAIEILNRFDSFEAADNFLIKNYADKNNWAAKQATVDRLYEILNRKFKK